MKEVESNLVHSRYESVTFSPAIRHGILLGIMMLLIFLVARFFDAAQILWLRYINYALFFPIAYLAIKRTYQLEDRLQYFRGLLVGFLTCLIGQLAFTLFFYIYLHIDKDFLSYLIMKLPDTVLYPEISISFLLISEGLAWSIITSFSLMQIFKWKRGRWAVHN